jgi:hypothetical protein
MRPCVATAQDNGQPYLPVLLSEMRMNLRAVSVKKLGSLSLCLSSVHLCYSFSSQTDTSHTSSVHKRAGPKCKGAVF